MGKLLSGGVATDKEGVIIDSTDLPEAKDHFLKVLELEKKHLKHSTILLRYSLWKATTSRLAKDWKGHIDRSRILEGTFFPRLHSWRIKFLERGQKAFHRIH